MLFKVCHKTNLSRLNIDQLHTQQQYKISMGPCSTRSDIRPQVRLQPQPIQPQPNRILVQDTVRPFFQIVPLSQLQVKVEVGISNAQNKSLESFLEQRFTIPEHNFKCASNNKIKQICSMQNCEKVFKDTKICGDAKCPTCGLHKKSHFLWQDFDNITLKLRQNATKYKEFILKLKQIHTETIKRMVTMRINYIDPFNYKGFQDKHQKLIRAIYANQNIQNVTSQEFIDLHKRLLAMQADLNKSQKCLIWQFKKTNQQLQKELFNYWNELFSKFSMQKTSCKLKIEPSLIQEKEVRLDRFRIQRVINRQYQQKAPKKPDPSPIIKQIFFEVIVPQPVLPHSTLMKNSKILLQNQAQFLAKCFKNPKEFQLLFRASEYAFKAQAFHQKCDNIQNTLTVVRTEFGKTIAGFSQYTWNAVDSTYVSEKGKNAFLVSLDLKEKMVPNDSNNLIFCNPTYGPTFGQNDLYIADQCNINANSCADFPNQYNKEGQNKYKKNQNNYKLFSGAQNGYNFKVTQYEVFRVIC